MDKRLTFGLDPAGYERLRPTYSPALFADVLAAAPGGAGKRALEIGIGTGQATRPFLQAGYRVTAVEISPGMAAFVREKYRDWADFEVVCAEFEGADIEAGAYDLVYSASAFHWVPEAVGLPKVLGALKSGGVFAWIDVQPTPAQADMDVYDAVQAVYAQYCPQLAERLAETDPEARKQAAQAKRARRVALLTEYGFVGAEYQAYEGTRTYGAADYAALLQTYSDHRVMEDAVRVPFLREVEETIARMGGKVGLVDTMTLCMGRKG